MHSKKSWFSWCWTSHSPSLLHLHLCQGPWKPLPSVSAATACGPPPEHCWGFCWAVRAVWGQAQCTRPAVCQPACKKLLLATGSVVCPLAGSSMEVSNKESQLGVGAPWRSDSDVQVARYPPAARVFQSLVMAGLNAKLHQRFQNEPGFSALLPFAFS